MHWTYPEKEWLAKPVWVEIGHVRDWEQFHLPCVLWSKWGMSAFQNTWISTSFGVEMEHVRLAENVNFHVCLDGSGFCPNFRKRDFPRLLWWKWGRSGFQKQWIGSCQFSWNVKCPVRFGGNWTCLVSQKSGDPWPELGLAGLHTKWHSMSGWVEIGHLRKPKQPKLHVRFDGKWACPDWSALTSLFWNKREEPGWMGSTHDGCGWGVSSHGCRWWGGYQKSVGRPKDRVVPAQPNSWGKTRGVPTQTDFEHHVAYWSRYSQIWPEKPDEPVQPEFLEKQEQRLRRLVWKKNRSNLFIDGMKLGWNSILWGKKESSLPSLKRQCNSAGSARIVGDKLTHGQPVGNNSPQCDGLRVGWHASSGPGRVATGNFYREGLFFVSRRVVFVMIHMNSGGLRPWLGRAVAPGLKSPQLAAPGPNQSFFLSNILFFIFESTLLGGDGSKPNL